MWKITLWKITLLLGWDLAAPRVQQVPALSMVVMAPHWATMVPDVVPEPVMAPATEAVPEAVPEEVEAEPQQVEDKPTKKALSTLSTP